MSSSSASGAGTPVVVKISPMAHLAVGFFALGLLALVLTEPVWFAPLLILPIAASVAIFRYRTVADRDTVTARTLLSSRTVPWSDIDGLRFDGSSWALGAPYGRLGVPASRGDLRDAAELTAATDGRVPNPYD